MRVPILNSNSQGMIRDLSDTTLLLEQWTWVEGARVEDGKIKRFRGPELIGLDSSVTPTAIFSYRRGDRDNALFLLDNSSIWFTEGGALVNVSQGGGTPYTATPNSWTYTNFNGVPIFNTPAEIPQAGEMAPPLTALQDMSNWPATWLCECIRSFKTMLLALNLTIAGTAKPHQFAHSNIVEDPFIVPADWDVADPTSVAGLDVLSDTEGPIIDGLRLRELFVLYKDHQAYVLTLGGQNILSIYPTFTKGLIAKNCVVEISLSDGPKHFCVGQEDIYLSTGYAEQSISNDRLSKWFYDNITVGLEPYVHVKHHPSRQEVHVLFPYGEAATGCNMALVYNYRRPAFYLLPLASGVVTYEPSLFNIADIVDDSWDAAIGTWDSDTARWDAFPKTYNTTRLTAVSGGRLVYLDQAETCDASVILERSGLAITGKDYRGNPTYDPDVYKYVNDIFPRFSGSGTVSVEVPVQELPDGTITYLGPWEFDIGDRRVENTYAQGNLIGIRFESTDDSYWEMIGYDIDLVTGGR